MDLFTYEDGVVKPSLHALIIRPFKDIWEQDTDPVKAEAMQAFKFIELFGSPKSSNPYVGYDKDQRYAKLKEDIYGSATYDLPYLITDAITKYEELLDNSSPTYSFLRACLEGAEKVKESFRTIDLNARTNSGTAVYKPKDITGALKDVEDISRNISNLLKKTNDELLSETRTRNDRQVGFFEE